jgi:hypothetical protein
MKRLHTRTTGKVSERLFKTPMEERRQRWRGQKKAVAAAGATAPEAAASSGSRELCGKK